MHNYSEQEKDYFLKIRQLVKDKNAVILAHNYQTPDIYEVADEIGDSYELAKKAMNTNAKIIVFAGVHFMAESAKLLNPQKKVLIPDKNALCPMAAMVSREKLQKLKNENPKAATVCYINTTAETKAECDVCVTSANALEICRKLPEKEIIFLPDKNLAEYVQSKLPEKKIIPFQGFCHVHNDASKKLFEKTIRKYPNAKVIIHPETPKEFWVYADEILGTGGMLKYAKESKDKEFLIGTENGMTARLKRENPDKEFIPLMTICPNMKKVTLQKIYETLLNETNEINIDEDIFDKAKKPLLKMMEMSE